CPYFHSTRHAIGSLWWQQSRSGAMVDERRIAWVQAALKAAKLDAVVCALPVHVLLLTGYWPVLGTSLAVATADGGLGLIVPEDELELTGNGRFDHLLTFPTGLP